MEHIFADIDAWLVASTVAFAMVVSWLAGRWRGHRLRVKLEPPGQTPVSTFEDASLAVLGLLLAFTFSAAHAIPPVLSGAVLSSALRPDRLARSPGAAGGTRANYTFGRGDRDCGTQICASRGEVRHAVRLYALKRSVLRPSQTRIDHPLVDTRTANS
jgi:hypothetical protein